MQWGCCPQGCRVGSLPGAGCALSVQEQSIAGRPLANSALPCWQTAVLGHPHSSSSPSHLILEELGLVLATRQSLNKAKDLGINGVKCQDRSNVSGWRPPHEPTSSLPQRHFAPCKVTWLLGQRLRLQHPPMPRDHPWTRAQVLASSSHRAANATYSSFISNKPSPAQRDDSH